MTENTAPVLVVGGINADVLGRTLNTPVLHTSNPARASVTPGGVARNIAETLERLGVAARLLGAVGDDVLGAGVLDATARAGVDVSGVLHLPGQTGTYVAVLNEAGELHIGLAAMELTDALTPEVTAAWAAEVAGARLLVLDANLPPGTVRMLLDAARAAGVQAILDPVSAPKAARLRGLLEGVWLLTPDRAELDALGGLDEVFRQGVHQVLLTLGAAGSVLHTPGQPPICTPAPAVSVQDVTGAGRRAGVGRVCRAGARVAAARRGARGPRLRRPDRAERQGGAKRFKLGSSGAPSAQPFPVTFRHHGPENDARPPTLTTTETP